MKYSDFEKILLTNKKFPTYSELLYKQQLSQEQLTELKQYIDKLLRGECDVSPSWFTKISLVDEMDKNLFFITTLKMLRDMKSMYSIFLEDDNIEKFDKNYSLLNNSFILSEIEHSLAIENIYSTRKLILDVKMKQRADLSKENEIIIKNMLNAFEFIYKSDITLDNFYKLYDILSQDCLDDASKIELNSKHRMDAVIISDGLKEIDKGVEPEFIKKMLENLIDYINDNLGGNEKVNHNKLQLSHIAHYYILYIHPFYDFNGRIARVMSYWIMLKTSSEMNYYFLSEAINRGGKKSEYYKAIRKSREHGNNLTFFIEYLGEINLKYTANAINLVKIKEKVLDQGVELTKSQERIIEAALKIPILEEGYFNFKRLNEYMYEEKSKQYLLREFKNLEELGVLQAKQDSKTAIYKVDYERFELYKIKK